MSKKYTREIKKQVVEEYIESGMSYGELASKYGIAKSTVYNWINSNNIIDKLTENSSMVHELRRLEQLVLTQEKEIETLKKACFFFAERIG